MKKILSFVLAAAMLMSLFSFVSCSEQTVNDVLDAALAVVEALPDAESDDDITSSEAENTEDDTGSAIDEALREDEENSTLIDENGSYDDRDSVALYIHTYGKLPKNYITKAEAEALGWEGGSVERYAEGKCIGGSKFGNYEGLLPKKDGRQYYECDIDTLGKNSRGAKRIVYSNDGLIYYTDDHYESFELLYGED